jgi:hypothetical protein
MIRPLLLSKALAATSPQFSHNRRLLWVPLPFKYRTVSLIIYHCTTLVSDIRILSIIRARASLTKSETGSNSKIHQHFARFRQRNGSCARIAATGFSGFEDQKVPEMVHVDLFKRRMDIHNTSSGQGEEREREKQQQSHQEKNDGKTCEPYAAQRI